MRRRLPNHTIFLAILTTLAAPVGAFADKFPDYLSAQYQPYFARYVDNRSLSEQMLNSAHLTSKEYGRGFALIAGVSKYPYMTGSAKDLSPAAEDVRKLVNYLVTYEKFDEVVVLKDADVTDANLSYFLQRYFPRRLQEFPKSRFLFAYSGHGATLNNRGYLLTSEARNLTDTFDGIPMNTLRAMFQQIVDSGFHVLALINACYSGDFLKRSFGGETHFIPKYAGAHAITAGGTGELTWHDGSVGTGSVFFEKFFAALDGRVGKDGIVTVDELSAYLRREVQISTDQQQNPLPGDLSRDGSLGGFFFFNRRPLVEANVLPAWDPVNGLPFGAKPGEISPSTPTPSEKNALETKTRLAALLSEAYTRLKNGEYNQAIADYTDVIRVDPNVAAAYIGRGDAYQGNKDYDRAIADYSEAIRVDPKDLAALLSRGNAHFSKKELDLAGADYSELIRLNRQYFPAFVGRGNVYYSKADFGRAIEDYSEAIRLDPTSAFGFCGRGSSYHGQKDYNRAIADYNEAIRLDPKFALAFRGRGTSYSALKDYAHAIVDYNEGIRLDPRDSAIFENRGNAYLRLQNHDHAIADYNEAIRLDPTVPSRFFNRGNVYLEQKDYARAIAEYNEAIRLNPTYADAFFNRGIAKQRSGDTEGGARDIAKGKQLNPLPAN